MVVKKFLALWIFSSLLLFLLLLFILLFLPLKTQALPRSLARIVLRITHTALCIVDQGSLVESLIHVDAMKT